MGILSSTVSISRFKVNGQLKKPVMETVEKGLKNNVIMEIDKTSYDKASGWTSFSSPFKPDFSGSSFVMGTYFVFSLRIDKKNMPSKMLKKFYSMEIDKQLAETGRDFLTKREKSTAKEHVVDLLNMRIPATPNIYDLVWNYEESDLWFFSNVKAANEELETLFIKSFNLTLLPLFPYTQSSLLSGLTDAEQDILHNLSLTKFSE